ncbi:MAG: hypothetical protein M3Q97_05255, partial [Bacteroidota bacterium]|nr:hypothetical protein [Bacteroidota bacterium]
MSLFEKHQDSLIKAIKANRQRAFYAAYPEHPKVYGEEGMSKAQAWFE